MDCSASYYDESCGICPTTGDTQEERHQAAPTCNAYSAELNSAFSFAYTYGITTIADCEKSNLG